MIKRNIQMPFRLNRQEAQKLNKLVKKSGLSREAYMRHLISGVIPKEAPSPDYHSMMRELHHIGNNLNQIALKAHNLNLIDAERYEKEVAAFKRALETITNAVIRPTPM